MSKQFSIEQIIDTLRGLTNDNFYGSLNIEYMSGRIVHCVKQESLSPQVNSEKIALLESST